MAQSISLTAQLLALRRAHAADLRAPALVLAKTWLAQRRTEATAHFLASGDANVLLAAHSAGMDTLLSGLTACFCGEETLAGIALIAVGGYGRRELFPYSDIDLLFLYDDAQETAAKALAEFVLYVLWDIGLSTGAAQRSVVQALALAHSDMTIRTGLLDARLVAGDQALFSGFMQRFTHKVAGSVSAFISAKLNEREARHKRWGDSRYMLEPNVKEGKGGLRDLHSLWWMARAAYPIAGIKELTGLGALTREEYRAFVQARAFLARVRIHLHLLAGRAEERLTFDRQLAVAQAMGFSDASPNRAIERFMRRYFAQARTVGTMTRIFCALLAEEKKGGAHTPLALRWAAPWLLGGFTLEGQRLSVHGEQAFANPLALLELFHIAQQYELDIHPRALRLVAHCLGKIDQALRENPQANQLFLDMLLSNKGAEVTLRRMSDAGVLGRFIPEFGRIIGQTQFNRYHSYTVDAHTLMALGLLHALERGNLRKEFPLASELLPRLTLKRVLPLALFCHDIAKGRGRDHSELGERITLRLSKRFGYAPEEAQAAAWLVRQHLLFSHTAFKRDLDDPKTIADFVAEVRTPERLRLLLVLTVIDIRAVGPGVWNEWKGGLLRALYHRAEQSMGTGRLPLHHAHPRWLRQDVARLLPAWNAHEVDDYLEQLSSGFIATTPPARLAELAELVRQAEGNAAALALHIHQDSARAITDIALCVPDRGGLFSQLAGALALSGATIITAKIFTLNHGLALDVFQVQDVSGQLFDRAERIARLKTALMQALENTLDLRRAFAPAPAYLSASRNAMRVPAQVFIDNQASALHSVIEVSGHDRPGFLYAITHAMAALKLSIATAHVSTYGIQAADVFYVKDNFGMKITHEERIRQVRSALLQAADGGGGSAASAPPDTPQLPD